MNPKAQFAKGFFLAYFLFCASLLLLRALQPHFWMVLFPDDAYYYLRTAQNLASSLGSTFDGINRTNGYQPLWMLLLWMLAGLFKDPTNLLHATLAFQVLTASAGFAFLSLAFSRTGKAEKGLWIAAALVFLNPVAVSVFINGLESAVYFLALSFGFWLWTGMQENSPPSWKSWFGAGLVFGTVFLSRLDGGILALWLGIAILISQGSLADRIRKAAWFSAGFILLAAPYLAYNFFEFGHPMPISGRVKAYYLSHNPAYLAGLGMAFMILLGGLLLYHYFARERLSGFARTWLSFLEFALSAVFYYLLSPIFALGAWYYLPLMMVAILALGWLFSTLIDSGNTLKRAIAGALAAMGVSGILAGFFLYVYPPITGYCQAQAEVAEWIREHTPKDARFAAWSSGAVAYFSDRTFVNLDGLINSADYFFNYRAKGKRDEFMKKTGVDYLVICYSFERPVPNDKFSFGITNVFESKVKYRPPLHLFRSGMATYYVLQTDFCKHPPK